MSDLNARVLGLFPERDPAALAQRLRADIDDILAATETADPATPVAWLGDSRVPICGVLAHLVNELQIHGRDIARATRRPWAIPQADAALFCEVFFVELLRNDVGRLLDNDEPPRGRRIAIEFRSAHTTPVTIVLHRGLVSVAEPGGDPDMRISFDPPTLNLMMFQPGRQGARRAHRQGDRVGQAPLAAARLPQDGALPIAEAAMERAGRARRDRLSTGCAQ